jgi:peroxiredoxin
MWVRVLRVVKNVLPILIYFVSIALLVNNIVLKRRIDALRHQPTLPIAAKAGQQLQDMTGFTLDGQPKKIKMRGRGSRLVVIAYSPGCPFCRANEKGWMVLSQALRRNGWTVIWLSRDPIDITMRHCVRAGIPKDDVVAEPTFQTYYQFALASVPSTTVVGPGGIIEKVWSGRLNAAGWQSLFTYLRLDESHDLVSTLIDP